jgi:hypothetical protein
LTLQDRIELIDALINENPDATIRHYLELTGVIQGTVEFIDPPLLIPVVQKDRKPRKLIPKQYHKYSQNYRLRL